VGRNRQGRFSAAPGRGLGKRSPQRPVAGRFAQFPPTNAGRGQGRWPWDGRQLETAASTCETAGGGWSQPQPGGLANEACNLQLPGVLYGFHPWTMAAAGEQCGSEAASSWKLRPSVAKPPGAVGRSPRKGALQMKPATSSCRAFCAASTHERWPRPRGGGPDTAGSWKLRPPPAKPPGAVGRSPRRGLCR